MYLYTLLFLCIEIVISDIHMNKELKNKSHKGVPNIIKANENNTVLLPCYYNTSFRYIRWHKDEIMLLDTRYPDIKPPERFSLLNNGSLQLSNIQPDDTGEYECEILVGEDRIAQLHVIEVQYKPSVTSYPSGVVEFPIGAYFEMVCIAKGVPHPTVAWRVNGETIAKLSSGNRQSYVFNIISRNMSGTIDCLATNGVGNPANSGIYLHVLFPPEVKAIQSIVYSKIGNRVHLECIVEAAPAATIQWFHRGVVVPMSLHISKHDTELQSNSSIFDYITKTKNLLTIKKLRDVDMGQYECRAQNKIGSNSAFIEVTGRPMPCVFKINHGIQSATSHTLVWQTESLSPVIEFKLKFRNISSGNLTRSFNNQTAWTELIIPAEETIGPIFITSYTLHGLQPANVFEAGVLARNGFGWSDNSKIVRFATGGEVELPNYSTESQFELNETDIDTFNEIPQRRHHSNNLYSGNSGLADLQNCILIISLVSVLVF